MLASDIQNEKAELLIQDEQSAQASMTDDPNDDKRGSSSSMQSGATATAKHVFVPSLEGLRGVAVLCTEYVHIGLDLDTLPFGMAGVAIFFVLSGYLITGVLLKLQTTHKSTPRRLLRFYNDRTVRLYPALVFMVIGVTAFRYHWTAGVMPGHTSQDMAVALTYMVDVRFLFLDAWKTSQFPNVWSLSVEEKFYVIWSLALPIIAAMSTTARKRTLAAMIAASLSLNFATYLWNPVRETVFLYRFAPFPHFYKMIIGAWLRMLPVPSFTRSRWASWIGLAAVPVPVLIAKTIKPIDTTTWTFPPRNDLSFEIFWELWPTLAGVLIICGSIEHGNWLLECHPLRFIGRVSYAFYLWQVPLLLVITGREPWEHGYNGITTTAFALVMAMISTFYVEEPLRERYMAWKKSKQETSEANRNINHIV